MAALLGLGSGAWLASSGSFSGLVANTGGERVEAAGLRLDTGIEGITARVSREAELEATRIRR